MYVYKTKCNVNNSNLLNAVFSSHFLKEKNKTIIVPTLSIVFSTQILDGFSVR